MGSIKGSPASLRMFGIDSPTEPGDPDPPNSPDTPKRQCFRSPKTDTKQDSVSPLSVTINNSILGIYCSQERKKNQTSFEGPVWDAVHSLNQHKALEGYCVKNVLNGDCLYKGKVAHLAVLIKSVECLSQKETSVILCDNTGEIKGAVHKRVMEKHGSFLQPGSAILLRQSTIFSFISIQKYINITLPNIIYIFNSNSTCLPHDLLNTHLKEVSKINDLKISCPDSENVTPNVAINTPNRPPPRRVPRTNTPTSSKSATAQQQGYQRTWSAPQSPVSTPQRPVSTPQRPVSTPQRLVSTPQRLVSTPQRAAPAFPSTTPQRFNKRPPETDVRGQKRRSGELSQNSGCITPGRGATSGCITPGRGANSAGNGQSPDINQQAKKNRVSPSEQEEIAKLLENIDDSFFDDF